MAVYIYWPFNYIIHSSPSDRKIFLSRKEWTDFLTYHKMNCCPPWREHGYEWKPSCPLSEGIREECLETWGNPPWWGKDDKCHYNELSEYGPWKSYERVSLQLGQLHGYHFMDVHASFQKKEYPPLYTFSKMNAVFRIQPIKCHIFCIYKFCVLFSAAEIWEWISLIFYFFFRIKCGTHFWEWRWTNSGISVAGLRTGTKNTIATSLRPGYMENDRVRQLRNLYGRHCSRILLLLGLDVQRWTNRSKLPILVHSGFNLLRERSAILLPIVTSSESYSHHSNLHLLQAWKRLPHALQILRLFGYSCVTVVRNFQSRPCLRPFKWPNQLSDPKSTV
jgi:hypothetical protein